VLKIGLNPGALQGGSGEQYFIGQFDGARFVNDNPASLTLWTDYGKDCYCALTFNNLPRTQSQVMLGWMNNWQYAGDVPTQPWRGQMTVPRKLALRDTSQGLRLVQNPIHSLDQLRQPSNPESEIFELQATVPLRSAREVGWKLLAGDSASTLVGYDREKQQLFVDRTHSGATNFSKDFPARTTAPLRLTGNELRVHILVDRSSIEVFADDGLIAMTNLIFPPPGARRIEFYSKGGQAGAVKTESRSLRSIW
jgi:fructan beta-fructosidase